MTRDEILNMPAGREMDLLVCRHVIGIELVDTPDYSIDIGAAWEVARKFPEIYMEHSKKNNFAMIGNNFDTAVTCEAMPLAICRAALLAVMGKP